MFSKAGRYQRNSRPLLWSFIPVLWIWGATKAQALFLTTEWLYQALFTRTCFIYTLQHNSFLWSICVGDNKADLTWVLLNDCMKCGLRYSSKWAVVHTAMRSWSDCNKLPLNVFMDIWRVMLVSNSQFQPWRGHDNKITRILIHISYLRIVLLLKENVTSQHTVNSNMTRHVCALHSILINK